LTEPEINDLLSLLYYPQEAMDHFGIADLTRRRARSGRSSRCAVSSRSCAPSRSPIAADMSDRPFRWNRTNCFRSCWPNRSADPSNFLPTLVASLAEHENARETIRAASHVVRKSRGGEIIVAGIWATAAPVSTA